MAWSQPSQPSRFHEQPGGDPPGTGSPVGALWVAGLGAFLLVVAAATFVAVRWDQISDEAKLATLVALTAVFLTASRLVRPALPATATVLLHLGVLLTPVDAAAIAVGADWDWSTLLLAVGVTATAACTAAVRTERSVVLRAVSWLAVVVLAAGVGATTEAPTGLVLAAVALAAVAARRPDADLDLAAAGWAGLAGLAVPLAGLERAGIREAGVLADLGLVDLRSPALVAAAGAVAGVALGVVGQRRRSVPTALAGIASALVGAVTAWAVTEPDLAGGSDPDAALAAVAALVLIAEAAAWTWRADPFWRRPTGIVAGLGEAVAAALTVGFATVVVDAPVGHVDRAPLAGLAAGLLALGWLAAAGRSAPALATGPAAGLAPVAAALTGGAGVALLSGSVPATAAALAVLGGAVVLMAWDLGSRRTPTVLAVGLVAWAPAVANDTPALVAGLALGGGLAVAGTVVRATRALAPDTAARWAVPLTPLSLAPVAAGGYALAVHGRDLAAAAGGVVGAWLVAAVLDRARADRAGIHLDRLDLGPLQGTLPPAAVARVAALVPLLALDLLTPAEAAITAGLVAALALLDAVRLRQPALLLGTGAALPIAIVALARWTDRPDAEAGLAITLSGVLWFAVGGRLPRRWSLPALAAALLAGGAGLVLSMDDPVLLGVNLLVTGATVIVAGLAFAQDETVVGGMVLATLGTWALLSAGDVTASEPYLAPVAAMMLAAGLAARRRPGTSSWWAYTPAIALLGGAALAERWDGGPAGHALVAGAVGMAAVTAGAGWRLAGPLLTGTTLVLAVTVHETLGVTAGLPTWAWLAGGGALLLAAGVTMERRGVGPVDTGRRLVDVVQNRFS